MKPYLLGSYRSIILKKAHYAKFWKIVILLTCVGYSSIFMVACSQDLYLCVCLALPHSPRTIL